MLTLRPPLPLSCPQEVLSSQLAALPPLAQVPKSTRPGHFPAPPQEGGRGAAARQAHALALAEARVGSRWWAPLRWQQEQAQDTYGGSGSGGGIRVSHTTWGQVECRAGACQGWGDGGAPGEDTAWRCAWERILREEAARPSGVTATGAGAQPVIEYSLESL